MVTGEVLGGGGVFATTALEVAVAETVVTGTSLYGSLTVTQLAWIQRMAALLGLAGQRIAAYEAGNYAELDKISALWASLFRYGQWIR